VGDGVFDGDDCGGGGFAGEEDGVFVSGVKLLLR
jgi:hypothetical protein